MEEYWGDVEDALQSAELIAFDGCHKIYLAMDAEQAEWFRKNYNEKECETSCNFTGSTQEMLTKALVERLVPTPLHSLGGNEPR